MHSTGGLEPTAARYDFASAPVSLSLASLSASGGDGTERSQEIEDSRALQFNDSLTGDSAGKRSKGALGTTPERRGGNDFLYGERGNDTLDGGPGLDYAQYDGSSGAVTANLATLSASGADGSDTYVAGSIEGLAGSAFNDTLKETVGPTNSGDEVAPMP